MMPEQTDETPKETSETTEKAEKPQAKQPKIKRFFKAYWRKKRWTLPVTVLALLVVLLAIPMTRFLMLGWFWQENVTFTVYDSQNHSRVTQATVKLDGKTAKTDGNGQANIQGVHIGNRSVEIEKKYYKTSKSNVTVDVFSKGKNHDASLVATGRLNRVTVTNRISGDAIKGVLVDGGEGNQAKTDEKGVANVVIPAERESLEVTLTADGFNDTKVGILQGKESNLQLVPSGKMFFLSKASGKIDVIKTNYDGSDRQVILAGTGQEDDNDTSLLASRDWKYLLLKAKRESNKTALHLISTTDGSVSTIDQGDADFNLIGWSNHHFVYTVYRNNVPYWQAKRAALKSVNAENKQLATIDENSSAGDQWNGAVESLANFYILDNLVTYTKSWSANQSYNTSSLAGKQMAIVSANPDGSNKKTLKTFPSEQSTYINAKLYKPQEVYYSVTAGNDTQYFELEDGAIKSASSNDNVFNQQYPTFLVSPDGAKTFWAESRDGKNLLFIGGKNGENGDQLTAKSEFKPYGWMTDDYLLMQKNNSELYITTKDQIKKSGEPLKISDYHKPAVNYPGYGYGYGGL
jgi:hypothetical protein